jgi:hypothetical protein
MLMSAFGCSLIPLAVTVATFLKGVVQVLLVPSRQWECGPRACFAGTNARFAAQWICGVAILVALPIFSQSYRYWGTDSPSRHDNQLGIAGKFASWAALGFLVGLMPSPENTLHKTMLRIVGTLAGGLMALAAVGVCGSDNSTGLLVWLVCTLGVSVAVSCHAEDPLLGYNVSYGYAFQLFTYTQAIVVIEAYHQVSSVGQLFVSRVFGQLVGTLVAVAISHVVLPTSANDDILSQIIAVTQRLQVLFSALTEEVRVSVNKENDERDLSALLCPPQTLQECRLMADNANVQIREQLFREVHVFYTINATVRNAAEETRILLTIISQLTIPNNADGNEAVASSFRQLCHAVAECLCELQMALALLKHNGTRNPTGAAACIALARRGRSDQEDFAVQPSDASGIEGRLLGALEAVLCAMNKTPSEGTNSSNQVTLVSLVLQLIRLKRCALNQST